MNYTNSVSKQELLFENPLVDTNFFKSYALSRNISRIKFLCAVMIAQSIPLFTRVATNPVQTTPAEYGLVTLIVLSCVMFVFVSWRCNEFLVQNYALGKVVVGLIWVSAIILDIPSSMYDAAISGQPLSITTWLATLIIFLVLSRRQIVMVFMGIVVLNLAVAWYADASSLYIINITGRGILAGFVAYFLQYPASIAAVVNIKNSNTDSLTELFNRRGGLRRINSILKDNDKKDRYTVFYMLDIDNFKMYNDTFGHPEGDKVIRAIAECVLETFSYKRDISIRYGGEEILAIATMERAGVAEILANKLHAHIEECKIQAPEGNFHPYVTVSLGYVVIAPDAKIKRTPNDYIQMADVAMYRAKTQGKNCTVAHEEIM